MFEIFILLTAIFNFATSNRNEQIAPVSQNCTYHCILSYQCTGGFFPQASDYPIPIKARDKKTAEQLCPALYQKEWSNRTCQCSQPLSCGFCSYRYFHFLEFFFVVCFSFVLFPFCSFFFFSF